MAPRQSAMRLRGLGSVPALARAPGAARAHRRLHVPDPVDGDHVVPGRREDVPAHDGVDPLGLASRELSERLSRATFTQYFFNSAIVSIAVMVGNVVFCTLAGYGLAKFRFPGDRFVLLAILSTLMLPLEVTLVPTFLVIHQFGWMNTYQGIIGPLLIDAFGVFLMRQSILVDPHRLHRGRAHRRGGRAAHPAADHRAAVPAGARRARDLLLPRQLGPVPVAADRRVAGPIPHLPAGPRAVRRGLRQPADRADGDRGAWRPSRCSCCSGSCSARSTGASASAA